MNTLFSGQYDNSIFFSTLCDILATFVVIAFAASFYNIMAFFFLTKKGGEILWYFEKFLIDKKGNLVERFRSGQNPLSKDVIKSINKLIN